MNTIFSLPMDIYKNRRLVAKLAKNDFKTRYAGSYLGIVWAFIQPVITILVYWFVFSVGFRSGTGICFARRSTNIKYLTIYNTYQFILWVIDLKWSPRSTPL